MWDQQLVRPSIAAEQASARLARSARSPSVPADRDHLGGAVVVHKDKLLASGSSPRPAVSLLRRPESREAASHGARGASTWSLGACLICNQHGRPLARRRVSTQPRRPLPPGAPSSGQPGLWRCGNGNPTCACDLPDASRPNEMNRWRIDVSTRTVQKLKQRRGAIARSGRQQLLAVEALLLRRARIEFAVALRESATPKRSRRQPRPRPPASIDWMSRWRARSSRISR